MYITDLSGMEGNVAEMTSEAMCDSNQASSDMEESITNNSFDIKIDAVFSLTDESSNKSHDVVDTVNQSDQENKSRDKINENDNNSPSAKSDFSGKHSSPATKSCRVVLKKINARAHEAVLDKSNVVVENILDDKSDRMRPSRNRKPSALLTSESYVKSLAEFRSQITISKMLKKQSQSNVKPEEKTEQDGGEIQDFLESEKFEDDSQPIIFNKKKAKKRQSEEKNKCNVDQEKTNESISKSEKSGKKKKKRKAPENEATEMNYDMSVSQIQGTKVKKIKQDPDVFEDDDGFTLTSIPVSPEITVQNVAEFPRETRMKSLLNSVLSKSSNSCGNDHENDPKQDYLKEISGTSNIKQRRVPCSLNGRCIKPNNKYLEEYLTDFSKKSTKKDKSETAQSKNGNSSSVSKTMDNSISEYGSHIKTESADMDDDPVLQQNEAPYPAMLVQNTSHLSTAAQNKPYLSALLTSDNLAVTASRNMCYTPHSTSSQPQHNNSIPSVVTQTSPDPNRNVAPQNNSISGIVSKLLSKTVQKDVAKATGTTQVSEGTKKFFHLQVGDKVVLIPTDGNVVIPKAYVMDIKQSEEFQSRLAAKKSDSDPPVKIKYKSAITRADGKPEVSAAVPPCINTAVSLLANTVSNDSGMIASNRVLSPGINEVGLHSSAINHSTKEIINDYTVQINEETNKNVEHLHEDTSMDAVKIKSEPIDEDYNDQEQQVLPEIKQEPELPETEQPEQDKQEPEQSIPNDEHDIPETEQCRQDGEQENLFDKNLPPLEDSENLQSLKESSPPVLTRFESYIPTFKDDLLNSPPLLLKSCSFDESEKDSSAGNNVEDNDKGGDSDVEVLIPETEVDMRIRRLKEQLRQKQQELKNFKMSFGGSKQK